MALAEDNAEEVEAVVKVASSSPFQWKRQVQVPTSNLFRLFQLFETRDAVRGCVEHYFASLSLLLEVYRKGTASQWLGRFAEETWRRS